MQRIEVIQPTGRADPAIAAAGDTFNAAHGAIVNDSSLQFVMEGRPVKPPTPPPDLSWLRFLEALGPIFQIIFWIGLGLIVLAILWFIAREVMRIRIPEKKPQLHLTPEEWRPTTAAAVALLSDADALAAEGRFAEAVHLLLLRSINDIDGRLPNAVRPALTARDIAGLERLPAAARPTFRQIAQAVEASLFGGGSVDQRTYGDCRDAYEAFAFAGTWTR
jgi:hypothetical protein